jgi:3-oxoacyl-[acyl-carrier protein] reductase
MIRQERKMIKFDFTNKLAVVTGGGQGIGFEMTKQFLQAGAKVAVWDYSTQALENAAVQLKAFEGKVFFRQVDVTQRESVSQAVKALADQNLFVDILVNNAGITRDKSFGKLTPEDWDAVIHTNLTGVFNVSKMLFERFQPQSVQKRIINISSVVGIYGNFGQTNYAATKAGVIGMTKTLAKELGRKGFTVNAIAPGFIQTPMTAAMPPEILAKMAERVPVGRLGTPEDIAQATLFLASEAASYINGAVLSVDGGIVL